MDLNSIAKMPSNLNIPPTLKKIQVSPELYNLIKTLFDREVTYGINFPPDVDAMWRGTPIEVDREKEGYDYEIVY
jgi:hypothetical protein